MTAVTLPSSALDELFGSEKEQRKLETVTRVRERLSIPERKSLIWLFLYTYRKYYDSCMLASRNTIRRDIRKFLEDGEAPLYFYRCLLPATGTS